MDHSLRNIKDARSIYFTSLLAGPERTLMSGEVNSNIANYDDYLDSVLQLDLEEKMKFAAFEAKKNFLKEDKRPQDENAVKLIQKNITLHDKRKSEFDHFINSLNEGEEWEDKESKLAERLKPVIPPLNDTLDEIPQRDMDDMVMKTKAKAEKIEELSKSLLLGVDLDYLQNEEVCSILLKSNLS